jgi:murein DD-endopeptidase MepM/ murein hydrolase activator NlpD
MRAARLENIWHISLFFMALSSTLFAGLLSCGDMEGKEDNLYFAPDSMIDQSDLRQVYDLDIGESIRVHAGESSQITLQDIETQFDQVRGAVRSTSVLIDVNGEKIRLEAGSYNLPQTIGNLRIDCPVTRDYYINTDEDQWGLDKDARLRVWPLEGTLFGEQTLVYPVAGQRWMASRTQAGNEPTDDYLPFLTLIYYHCGVDLGGTDGVDRVVAATGGTIVSADGEILPGYGDTPAQLQYILFAKRTDVLYILDDRGWYYRYSHLHSIDPSISVGQRVEAGDVIGLLGNEGHSGGWAHLHFEILLKQPSGRWGAEPAFPYLWEGYVEREEPKIIALARPHRFAQAGDAVALDGSKSMSFDGEIVSYEWIFTDGDVAEGETVEHIYGHPGFYTEILKVTDNEGNVAYDFPIVQVVHADNQKLFYTYMHASNTPSKNIHVGDEVLFKVRTFGFGGGEEQWDFGDGSSLRTTQSGNGPLGDYVSLTHSYAAAGDYLVNISRINHRGEPANTRLWVQVF